MQKLIKLLEDKNHFLEKFFSLNERELNNFSNGNFDGLENFYQTREKLIDLIRFVDAKIDQFGLLGEKKNMQPSLEEKQAIREAFSYKDKLAEKIMKMDLEILSLIEVAKSEIIRELKGVEANKNSEMKKLSRYKTQKTSRRLDEEA